MQIMRTANKKIQHHLLKALLLIGAISQINPAAAAKGLTVKQDSPALMAFSVLPYYARIAYSTAGKESRNIYGIYSYIGFGKHSVELEADRLGANNAADDNNEKDYVISYTNYQLPNIRLNVGARRGTTELKTDPKSFWIGAGYDSYDGYGYKNWNADVKLYQTRFDSDVYDQRVRQIDLSGTKYISLNTQSKSYLGVWGQLSLINVSESVENKTSFTQSKLGVDYYQGKTSVGVFVRSGGAPFVMDKGGFVFYKDTQINENAVGMSASYSLNDRGSFRLSVEKAKNHLFNSSTEETTTKTNASFVIGF